MTTRNNEGNLNEVDSKVRIISKHNSVSPSFRKIRNLINKSLKIHAIPKPSERMEESVVEDDDTENAERRKQPSDHTGTAQKSITPVIHGDSSLLIEKTQSETDDVLANEAPAEPEPNDSKSLDEDRTQQSGGMISTEPYDSRILEVKVKRRMRLYAKISFCLVFVVFTIAIFLFIFAALGWWVWLSTYRLFEFEEAVRSIQGWASGGSGFLIRQVAPWSYTQCRVMKISSLLWSSWTKCYRSKFQAVQWRWRTLSRGLYFVDEQLINIKRC